MALNNILNSPFPQTVPEGGLGVSSVVAYAPLCGGTTTTSAIQSANSGISNSGYVLTSTGASSIPTWQSIALGTGTIVQLQYGSTTTLTAIGNTYSTSGVTATITPHSTSNHILIIAGIHLSITSGDIAIGLKLYRDGSSIVDFGNGDEVKTNTSNADARRSTIFYYDNPATTSATTYALYVNDSGTGSGANVNYNGQLSNIILIEIAL